ncbi:hypothetical protein [Flexithrix dorotheae]|uniref:hypothetical protein n=1 Tax=Flexithrix dorotheae TaxID=70993 RepID=UPI0003635373|nr:hypothetical protein [Flexithrix dorotheae]
MDFIYFTWTPSQAFDRIEELNQKAMYERLSDFEQEELDELREVFQDSFNEYDFEF